MTYARTTAAAIATTIAFTALPQTSAPAATAAPQTSTIAVTAVAPMQTLPEVPEPALETIDGVRILSDSADEIAAIESALDKFEVAGWPLGNLEIRTGDEDGCGGNAGVRYLEEGYDVVEICTQAEWTLLHELGHVWAATYLADDQRSEWVAMRGLEVWSGGEKWEERGTEQLADIVAFGLYDEWHTPTSIAPNDRKSLITGFEWLFGMEPLNMQDDTERATRRAPQSQPIQVAPAPTVTPAIDGVVEVSSGDDGTIAPAGYRFPVACGFPRWHSDSGGYGYEDARDWTHRGVDLGAYEGTPVVAPIHGEVIAAGFGTSAGWNVSIEDRFGRVHVLMHLAASPLVAIGMKVAAGQTIGEVGRSGNASAGGPVLHYEIRDGDDTIDPMPWLAATGATNVSSPLSGWFTSPAPEFSACSSRA